MDEWKLYSVSDRYIHYLRSIFPNVYSNKDKTRLSSPDDSHPVSP